MALANTLSANFNSGAPTLDDWEIDAGIDFVNKRMEIPLASNVSVSKRIISVREYDLTENSAFVRMSGYREGATSSEAEFALMTNAASLTGLFWRVINGTIVASYSNAGTSTSLANFSYYPGNDAWFRIRHSGTTVYWETAPVTASNPPIESDWVQRASVSTPIAITLLRTRFRGGSFNTSSADPGTAFWDGYNTAQATTQNYQNIFLVGAAAAAASGATSVAPIIDAATLPGDRVFLTIASKYNDIPAPTETGWTFLSSHQGGIATAGVDSGSPRQTIYFKDAVSGDAGRAITITKTSETGTVMVASSFTLRRQTGSSWESFQLSKGADTTGGGNWLITGDASMDAREGDLFIAHNAINGDISTSESQLLSIGSATFGSMVEVRDSGSSEGDDVRLSVSLHYCTSGTGSGTPTFSFTSTNNTVSTTPAGPTILMRVRALPPVLQSYSLPLDSGAVAVAGQSATLRASRKLAAASGAIAVTGTAVALRAARKLSAASGAVSVTGTAATLRASRKLVLASGTAPVALTPATLRTARKLALASGSLALAGQAAALRVARRFGAASGSLDVTLGEFSFIVPAPVIKINADSGSVPVAGMDAALRVARRLSADSGAVGITGQQLTFLYGKVLKADVAEIGVDGGAVVLRYGRNIAAESGAVSVEGGNAEFKLLYKFKFDVGNVEIAAEDINFLQRRALAFDAGTIDIGGDAALRIDRRINADSGALAVDGLPVALRTGRRLALDSGALALAGDAALRVSRRINAAPSPVPVLGQAAKLSVKRYFPASGASVPVIGYDVPVTVKRLLRADVGRVQMFRGSANLRVGRRILADVGGIGINGNPVDLFRVRKIGMGSGAIALVGGDVDMRYRAYLRFGLDVGEIPVSVGAAGLYKTIFSVDPEAAEFTVDPLPIPAYNLE